MCFITLNYLVNAHWHLAVWTPWLQRCGAETDYPVVNSTGLKKILQSSSPDPRGQFHYPVIQKRQEQLSKWQASTCRTPWNDSLSSASDTITFSQSLSLTILNECCCHLGFLFSFVFHSILQVRSVSGKKQETMSTTLTLFWCNTNRNQDDIPQDTLHFLCFEILIWQ